MLAGWSIKLKAASIIIQNHFIFSNRVLIYFLCCWKNKVILLFTEFAKFQTHCTLKHKFELPSHQIFIKKYAIFIRANNKDWPFSNEHWHIWSSSFLLIIQIIQEPKQSRRISRHVEAIKAYCSLTKLALITYVWQVWFEEWEFVTARIVRVNNDW